VSSPAHGARPGRTSDDAARILDELTTLTRGRASGALMIDGHPGGAIYLDEGRLVFAEAAGVPDVGARLVGARRLSAEQWTALRAVDRPPGGLGALLVARGLVARDELLALLRSAALDAITALTLPMTGPPSVTRSRFAARERPWIGAMLTLDVESVRTELARRAELLAAFDVPADALLVGIDLRRPFGVVRREQWAVAGRLDGVTPLRELAWRHGLALYDTVESVGGLLRAGLCTLVPPPPSRRDEHPAGRGAEAPGPARPRRPGEADTGDPPWAPAVLTAPVPAADAPPRGAPSGGDVRLGIVDAEALARAADAGAAPPMPRRDPGATLRERRAEAEPEARQEQGIRTPFTSATPELLRRLLDGLRRLDEDDPPPG